MLHIYLFKTLSYIKISIGKFRRSRVLDVQSDVIKLKVVYIFVTVPTYERCSILIYAMKQHSFFLIWAMSFLLQLQATDNRRHACCSLMLNL